MTHPVEGMGDCRIIARPIGGWGDNSFETRETNLEYRYERDATADGCEQDETPAKVLE